MKSEHDEDWREMRPAWRISLLVMQTPFGWSKLDAATADQVRDRLARYESMKWKEFIPSYRSHFIKVTALRKEAQEHLTEIEQDDVDRLSLSGLTRKLGCSES